MERGIYQLGGSFPPNFIVYPQQLDNQEGADVSFAHMLPHITKRLFCKRNVTPNACNRNIIIPPNKLIFHAKQHQAGSQGQRFPQKPRNSLQEKSRRWRKEYRSVIQKQKDTIAFLEQRPTLTSYT